MLFSQPGIAAFLSDAFECAWESVRPVPRLSIDFGNGRRLERTLRGNIATYLCTSDGETFDLVAGLVSGREYVKRLEEGLTLFEGLQEEPFRGRGPATERRATAVAGWHRALVEPSRLGVPSRVPGMLPDEGEVGIIPIQPSPYTVSARGAFSKMSVESMLEAAVVEAMPTLMGREPTVGPALNSRPPLSPLALDDMLAMARGYREAHALLAERALASPAELTRDVYRELLHVDLDDPYLGLAPDVLGGEVGRH